MPTNYGDVSYWDQRFAQRPEAFEWLKPCNDFMPYIRAAADSTPQDERLILHVGPGSSTLSLELRQLVRSPRQVHNVDFSIEAVQLGQRLEDAGTHTAAEVAVGANGDHRMLWTQADLLNTYHIHKLVQKNADFKLYNLIIDKGTSDSIACTSDVDYDPAMLTSPTVSLTTSASQSDTNLDRNGTKRSIVPVHLLALHMAAITAPGACWLVLSYSESRFPFLEKSNPFSFQPKNLAQDDLDPADYWSLESKQEVDRAEVVEDTGAGGHIVYRPVVVDWLYRLRRNDRSLGSSHVS